MAETMQTIVSRRTVRDFGDGIPAADAIRNILLAAVHAPYGGATGIPLRDLRRIVVFQQNTQAMRDARELLYASIRKGAGKLGFLSRFLPVVGRKMRPFANRLRGIADNGIPGLEKAAYYVVVAEKIGFPPVEKQSLAHVMQNMWLAATDQGVGFQMLSATGMMGSNKAFMELLGLPSGQYALDGCLLGFAAASRAAQKSLEVDDFVRWK